VFEGDINSGINDGQFKKTASNARLRQLVPNYSFSSLQEGINKTVQWFKQHHGSPVLRI